MPVTVLPAEQVCSGHPCHSQPPPDQRSRSDRAGSADMSGSHSFGHPVPNLRSLEIELKSFCRGRTGVFPKQERTFSAVKDALIIAKL